MGFETVCDSTTLTGKTQEPMSQVWVRLGLQIPNLHLLPPMTFPIQQWIYTESILQDFGYENCNSVSTPMDPGAWLSLATAKDSFKVKDFPYTSIVSKCMYLATCTWPDIAYTVCELARFMTSNGPSHIAAAKHLLRYLWGTTSHGITLGGSETQQLLFKALTDSDWGMGDSRKSVSGFLIMMGMSPLSWSSKQQAVVALSSCEAKYLATTHCTCNICWFQNLFTELSFPQTQLTSLFCDNKLPLLNPAPDTSCDLVKSYSPRSNNQHSTSHIF